MAITPTRAGSTVETTTSTTIAAVLTAQVNAAPGTRLIVGYCSLNTDTDGAITAVDSRGNSYNLDAADRAGARAVAVLSAPVTTTLQIGDTVTVTCAPSCTRRAIQIVGCTGITAIQTQAVFNSAGTATPDSGTTGQRPTLTALVFGVCGWSSAATGDLMTAGASFSNALTSESFSGATARYLGSEWWIPVASGNQSANCTLSVSHSNAMIAAVYGDILAQSIPLSLQHHQSVMG